MSHNDWESGTLTLPSAAVPGVRAALRNAANAHHAAVLAECLRMWNGLLAKTSSVKLYRERLNVLAMGPNSRISSAVAEDAYATMEDIVGGYSSQRNPALAKKPRMPEPPMWPATPRWPIAAALSSAAAMNGESSSMGSSSTTTVATTTTPWNKPASIQW